MANAVAPEMTETSAPLTVRWRVWPGVVIIALFWASYFILNRLDLPMFFHFLIQSGICALSCLLFLIWWLTNRSVARRDRFFALGALIAAIVFAELAADRSLGALLFIYAVPLSFSAWALWILIARGYPAELRRVGLIIALFVVWGFFDLLRAEGLDGAGNGDVYWRWTPTAEDLYLAELAGGGGKAGPIAAPAALQPGDWPQFRGPAQNGKAVGEQILADWETTAPKELWHKRVGWGWSSVAVVGERLFTQEQRGDQEAVVCLEAATGGEAWAHLEPARFSDEQSGTGPRATPTFADGRLYALGGAGTLLCLDAVSGTPIWKRDLRADAGAPLPLWGFSSSPLVVDGLVIVYAGGEGTKSLLAYRADTGDVAWTAEAGKMSYSSAQLAVLHGVKQVLFLGDRGLTSYDPATGAVLWEFKSPGRLARSLQPQVVGSSRILIGTGMEDDTAMLEVTRDASAWKVEQRWKSGGMRSSFNDFVVDNGAIFGFDKAIFCCLDLETGKQLWKDGRYGYGQVVLLADQHALLVVTDTGAVVLLAADPAGNRELGKKIQAVTGKTWNHPVVAHGRLYVRSCEGMACYELPAAAKP
jgi:outer membrane protein assembly factor BamB